MKHRDKYEVIDTNMGNVLPGDLVCEGMTSGWTVVANNRTFSFDLEAEEYWLYDENGIGIAWRNSLDAPITVMRLVPVTEEPKPERVRLRVDMKDSKGSTLDAGEYGTIVFKENHIVTVAFDAGTRISFHKDEIDTTFDRLT